MKKIYLLFLALFSFFGSTAVMAQEEENDISKLKTIEIGPALGSFETNTWYFLYQGRPYGADGSLDHLVPLGEIPSGDGGLLHDKGVGEKVFKDAWTVVSQATSSVQNAAYLVRFLPVEGEEDAYIIQFGTGNYVAGPAETGNSKNLTSTTDIYDAGYFNIYNIDESNPGYFGFNVAPYAQRIDNNGTGTAVVTWGTGKRTVVEAGNSIWSVHEVIWGEAEELEMLYTELEDLWAAHENDAAAFALQIGTLPGQYNEEAVTAFDTAMQEAYTLLDSSDDVTVEQLQAAIDAINTTYQTVLDSKVPFTLADGYYRLRAGMVYTNNVETGEKDGEGNPITESREVYKYMTTSISGTTINARWETPKDLTTDCPSLWKVTNKDGFYDLMSVATDARFNKIAQSTAATLSTESENLMAVDLVANVEGTVYVNIRVSTQAAGDYFYLHQNNHGGGTGTGSTIVGWTTTFDIASQAPKASEWVFEPVSDEDAAVIIKAYEPIKNHDILVEDYKTMLADAKAKLTIAKDLSTKVYENQPFVTDASQLSSPWTESSEGSIEALLDGDTGTFWHSAWQAGNVANHTHYLQVALNEPTYDLLAMSFTRRAVSNDHITAWSVYGSNDAAAEDAAWEKLAAFETPYSSNTETLVSIPFDTKGNQYLRFYIDGTTNNRGYGHMSEFQLYKGEINDPATSQYHVMGAIATALEEVINAQEGIVLDELTADQFNALKNAYDPFIAKFVDPTALREAIAAAETKTEIVEIGTQPGFWSGESGAGQLAATVADAKAYDEAGDYTTEQSEAYIEQMQSQVDDIIGSAIKVQEGKWYKFRFGTEEEFESHEWDKVAGTGGTTVNYEGQEYEVNEPLWGKYVTVANIAYNDIVADHVTESIVEPMEDYSEVTLGQRLYVDDTEDIALEELALFRFVNVGDTAYVIQNKATGLFLKAAGTSGGVTLSIQPSLFNVRAIGYGMNVMAAQNLITGAAQSYLHIQVDGNTLVTWNVDYPGSRSGLYIEEVGDVEETYEGTAFQMSALPGSVGAYCYPVEISAEEGLYGVNAVKVDADKNVELTIVPLETVAAGRPFILINGNPEDYDAEAEPTLMALKHGYEFVDAPLDGPVLKGIFSTEVVGYGMIVANKNGFAVTKQSTSSVGANEAYIVGSEKFDRQATVSFQIKNEEDAIATVLNKIAQRGAIYTLDGRLVSRSGNLNTLKQLGRGVYILNGAKVTVK